MSLRACMLLLSVFIITLLITIVVSDDFHQRHQRSTIDPSSTLHSSSTSSSSSIHRPSSEEIKDEAEQDPGNDSDRWLSEDASSDNDATSSSIKYKKSKVNTRSNSSLSSDRTSSFTFEPAQVDFDEISLCSPHLDDFSIINTSTQYDLTIFSVTSSSNHFHPATFKGTVIPPQGRIKISVIAIIGHLGAQEGELTVESSGGTHSLPVKGFGIPSPYRVEALFDIRVPISGPYSIPLKIFNPSTTDTLKIREIYTSEGFLHLHLPDIDVTTDDGRGQGGMWTVEPREARTISNLNFITLTVGVFQGFIHIRTQSDVIVIPVIIQSVKPGIHKTPLVLNFGTLTSPGETKVLPISLLNSSNEALTLNDVYTTAPDQQLSITFSRGTFLPPGIDTVIGAVGYTAAEEGAFSGRVMIRANGTMPSTGRIEIPYFSRVLYGNLIPNMEKASFNIHDMKNQKSVLLPIIITNKFATPVIFVEAYFKAILSNSIFAISTNESLKDEKGIENNVNAIQRPKEMVSVDGSGVFSLTSFTEQSVLVPNDNLLVAEVKFTGSVPEVGDHEHLRAACTTILVLQTNTTVLEVPIRCYHGKLEFSIPKGQLLKEKELDSNSLAMIDDAIQKRALLFGVLGVNEIRSLTFNLTNHNPVPITIYSYSYSLPALVIRMDSLWNTADGTAVTMTTETQADKEKDKENQGKAKASSLDTQNDKDINHKKNSSSRGGRLKPLLILRSGQSVSFIAEISSSQEEKRTGTILFDTMYESVSIFVSYQSFIGTLSFSPSLIRFEPTYPGRLLQKPLFARSTYKKNLKITSVSSSDSRYRLVLSHSELKPNIRQQIGIVYFDPSDMPEADDYMLDSMDHDESMRGVSIVMDRCSFEAAKAQALANGVSESGRNSSKDKDIEIKNSKDKIGKTDKENDTLGLTVAVEMSDETINAVTNQQTFHPYLETARQRNRKWRDLSRKGAHNLRATLTIHTDIVQGSSVAIRSSLYFPSVLIASFINMKQTHVGRSNESMIQLRNPHNRGVCVLLLPMNSLPPLTPPYESAPSSTSSTSSNIQGGTTAAASSVSILNSSTSSAVSTQRRDTFSFLPTSKRLAYVKAGESIQLGPIVYSPTTTGTFNVTLSLWSTLTFIENLHVTGSAGEGKLVFIDKIGKEKITEEVVTEIRLDITSKQWQEAVQRRADTEALIKGAKRGVYVTDKKEKETPSKVDADMVSHIEFDKLIYVKNIGNMPVDVLFSDLDGDGCHGNGFYIAFCRDRFNIPKGTMMELSIKYRPLSGIWRAEHSLHIITASGAVPISIHVTLPPEAIISSSWLTSTTTLFNDKIKLYLAGCIVVIAIYFCIVTKRDMVGSVSSANNSSGSLLKNRFCSVRFSWYDHAPSLLLGNKSSSNSLSTDASTRSNVKSYSNGISLSTSFTNLSFTSLDALLQPLPPSMHVATALQNETELFMKSMEGEARGGGSERRDKKESISKHYKEKEKEKESGVVGVNATSSTSGAITPPVKDRSDSNSSYGRDGEGDGDGIDLQMVKAKSDKTKHKNKDKNSKIKKESGAINKESDRENKEKDKQDLAMVMMPHPPSALDEHSREVFAPSSYVNDATGGSGGSGGNRNIINRRSISPSSILHASSSPPRSLSPSHSKRASQKPTTPIRKSTNSSTAGGDVVERERDGEIGNAIVDAAVAVAVVLHSNDENESSSSTHYPSSTYSASSQKQSYDQLEKEKEREREREREGVSSSSSTKRREKQNVTVTKILGRDGPRQRPSTSSSSTPPSSMDIHPSSPFPTSSTSIPPSTTATSSSSSTTYDPSSTTPLYLPLSFHHPSLPPTSWQSHSEPWSPDITPSSADGGFDIDTILKNLTEDRESLATDRRHSLERDHRNTNNPHSPHNHNIGNHPMANANNSSGGPPLWPSQSSQASRPIGPSPSYGQPSSFYQSSFFSSNTSLFGPTLFTNGNVGSFPSSHTNAIPPATSYLPRIPIGLPSLSPSYGPLDPVLSHQRMTDHVHHPPHISDDQGAFDLLNQRFMDSDDEEGEPEWANE